MIFEILNYINAILEIMLMYIALYLVERYIFFQPPMAPKIQKIFYAITVPILVILSVGFNIAAQVLVVLFSAVRMFLGRKRYRALGFILAFFVMGMVNGICVPIIVSPASILNLSNNANTIYRFVIMVLLYIGIVAFFIRGKKWRTQFDEEMQTRHLRKWEFGLLAGIGTGMTIYSFVFNIVPQYIDESFLDKINEMDKENVSYVLEYTNSLVTHSKIAFVFMTVICFTLSITAIIIIHQGNKRAYYQQKMLDSQIAEKERVERMSLQMVRTLANTIDAKDSYTNGHSTRVARYSVMIAQRMGYTGKELELLEYAALLHDIGKIGIPNEIINKPSRLTDEEYDVIKTHPGIGGKILEEISEIPDIAIGARYHHERYDGRGYPDKLSEMNIPEIARIIGVADAYDAMTSNRSYRDVLSQNIVRAEIEKGKGTQFDPEIADVMIELIEEDTEYTMHE